MTANHTGTARRSLRALLGYLIASYGAAALGGLVTTRALDPWYRALRRPRWTPPDWVFGPVWTVLYGTMAVSAWLIVQARPGDPSEARIRRAALLGWWAQLVLNALWSAVFFGLRSPAGGLAVIGLLWGALGTTAALALRVRRAAGLLLVPYLAWTTLAGALNARIWQLNRR